MGHVFEVGPGLACDLEKLVTTRAMAVANSGGGKTFLVRRLLEQTHGHIQHLVIDPEGEYHTLREKFGYVLAAAEKGDTLASPRTAALLAERLLEFNTSAILDIYELNPRDRQEFVQNFLTALVDAPRKLWHPALVVLDEAHVYAPEGGKLTAAGEAVAALATRGRKRGFCLVAATQRIAKFHKDVAAELNNVLIGRCVLDVDVKRAGESLGFLPSTGRTALPELEPGSFWAMGPAFLRRSDLDEPLRGAMRAKVGPVQTRHIEPGQQAPPPAPPSDAMRRVLAQMGDLPKANEGTVLSAADALVQMRGLEARIDVLEDENRHYADALSDARAALAQPMVPQEVPVLTSADTALLREVADAFRSMGEQVRARVELVDDRIGSVLAKVGTLSAPPPAWPPGELIARQQAGRPMLLDTSSAVREMVDDLDVLSKGGRLRKGDVVKVNTSYRANPASNIALSVGERKVLGAVYARCRMTHLAAVPRTALLVMTGYKRSSVNTYIQRLQSAGLLKAGGGDVGLTDEGEKHAAPLAGALPRGRALQEHLLSSLPDGESKILAAILQDTKKPGDDINKEHIRTVTGYERSSVNTYLQRLSARGIVESTRPGAVRASQVLF